MLILFLLSNRLYVVKRGYLPPFFVIGTPGGIGTLAVMTGAAPVPLAGVAKNYVHAEKSLYSQFKIVPRTWFCRFHQSLEINLRQLSFAGLSIFHTTTPHLVYQGAANMTTDINVL